MTVNLNRRPSKKTLAQLQAVLEKSQPAGITDIYSALPANYLVAEIGKKPVGVATVNYLGSSQPELFKLFVDPDHQKNGIASQLLGAVIKSARRAKSETLAVEISGESGGFWEKAVKDMDGDQVSDNKIIIKL